VGRRADRSLPPGAPVSSGKPQIEGGKGMSGIGWPLMIPSALPGCGGGATGWDGGSGAFGSNVILRLFLSSISIGSNMRRMTSCHMSILHMKLCSIWSIGAKEALRRVGTRKFAVRSRLLNLRLI
jgi:hypothetical protein